MQNELSTQQYLEKYGPPTSILSFLGVLAACCAVAVAVQFCRFSSRRVNRIFLVRHRSPAPVPSRPVIVLEGGQPVSLGTQWAEA